MKNDVIWIAVAETSVIIRSGLLTVLKHMPETNSNYQLIEISSSAALNNCLKTHIPDILIVNPSFEGWFNIDIFKSDTVTASVKCMALVCSMTDRSLLKKYDDEINIFNNEAIVYTKISNMLHVRKEEDEIDVDSLSHREKEIITYVVKGLTNKEIAEKLFISIHTVITHRRNIARKLQIHSSAGLTIYAIVNNLVKLEDIKM